MWDQTPDSDNNLSFFIAFLSFSTAEYTIAYFPSPIKYLGQKVVSFLIHFLFRKTIAYTSVQSISCFGSLVAAAERLKPYRSSAYNSYKKKKKSEVTFW